MAQPPPRKRPRGALQAASAYAPSSRQAPQGGRGWETAEELDAGEHEHGGDSALPAEALPCDTMAAIALLASECRNHCPQFPWPLVLKSQLYSIVNDHTIVDREVDQLRRSGGVRLFKLPLASDDYALLPAEDYRQHIETIKQAKLAEGAAVGLAVVMDWFVERVLPRCSDVSIAHNRLVDLLSQPVQQPLKASAARGEGGARAAKRGSGSGNGGGSGIKEQHIAFLLKAGCLTRQQRTAGSPEAFWFALPGAGPVLKEARAGRQELLGMLRKRQYSEMLEKDAEKKKLRTSTLGMRFHIRDLVGGGNVKRMQTTCGALLKRVDKC
mmetsp:Transcript_22593/g.57857  ORF Transcript_22593/g.57857 Transcript_22593/m.57857 type:complete len:326 (+) Transcript_22593:1-978(+)